VLLVGGDRDPVVARCCEEELLAGLPNAGRVELAGCGHVPQFTHPEALAQVTRRFLMPPRA
jgi:pimeloyl-ACP methyl ester carboxylesterase